MDVEQTVEQVRTKARANDYYSGCAQAVLDALQETLGIGDAESFKAATILSGGVARRGETCGALLGALMGLGLACGRDRMEDTAAYSRACDEAQPLVDAFKSALQDAFEFEEPLTSTLCRDIQSRLFGRSFYLADAADRAAFLAGGGHDSTKCPQVCAIAAEVAARKILALKSATKE
jgi:C_GCAxxG_C_C family probable redox protein